MTQIYKTTVVGAGAEAEAFKAESMMVLFGHQAPDNLKDYCYIIETTTVAGELAAGQTLVLDGREFPVTAVGGSATKNLTQLGHISIVFGGQTEAKLAGSVYVDAQGGEIPTLSEGSVMEFIG